MTIQIKDILVFNGNEYRLNFELLESYFKDHPERRPRSEVRVTALWRGYIATFEIKNDELLVKAVEILTDIRELSTQSALDKAFPDLKKLTWFSGLIRIDEYRGEYDDERPGSIFKFLEIHNGNLVNLLSMTYKELQHFKKTQLELFRQTSNYNQVLANLKNNGMSDHEAGDFIASNILDYTKEILTA